MTLSKASALFRRGKDIVREEGMMPFIMRAFLFLLRFLKSSFFSYRNYYIYEKTLNEADEAMLTPRLPNVTLKIIYSSEELDKLIKEGYDFKLPNFKERFKKGALPFCIFVEQELAHVTWVALDETAKKEIDQLPFKVDFQKGEVCSGGSFTDPRYRGRGLLSYVYSYIFPYLAEQGIRKDKFSIHEGNIVSQKAHAKFNPTITGKVRYLRLLWWEFWKKKPMKETKQQ